MANDFLNSLPGVSGEDIVSQVEGEGNQNAHLEKLISEIFKTDNIEIRSDLTKEQILVFSKALLYSSYYQVDIIKTLLNNYMTLSLSKNRASRKELVDIAKNMRQPETESSPIQKLLG